MKVIDNNSLKVYPFREIKNDFSGFYEAREIMNACRIKTIQGWESTPEGNTDVQTFDLWRCLSTNQKFVTNQTPDIVWGRLNCGALRVTELNSYQIIACRYITASYEQLIFDGVWSPSQIKEQCLIPVGALSSDQIKYCLTSQKIPQDLNEILLWYCLSTLDDRKVVQTELFKNRTGLLA